MNRLTILFQMFLRPFLSQKSTDPTIRVSQISETLEKADVLAFFNGEYFTGAVENHNFSEFLRDATRNGSIAPSALVKYTWYKTTRWEYIEEISRITKDPVIDLGTSAGLAEALHRLNYLRIELLRFINRKDEVRMSQLPAGPTASIIGTFKLQSGKIVTIYTHLTFGGPTPNKQTPRHLLCGDSSGNSRHWGMGTYFLGNTIKA